MKGGGKRPSPFQHVSWPVKAKSLLPTQPAWGPSHGMLPRTLACKGCTISEIKMEHLWKWRLIPLLKKPKSKAHLCLISSYKTIKRRHMGRGCEWPPREQKHGSTLGWVKVRRLSLWHVRQPCCELQCGCWGGGRGDAGRKGTSKNISNYTVSVCHTKEDGIEKTPPGLEGGISWR